MDHHINPVKIQMLADRMRSGKLPSRTPTQINELKPSTNSIRSNDDKMIPEGPKSQPINGTLSQQDVPLGPGLDDGNDSSDKENLKNQPDLESSEKIGDIKTKEATPDTKLGASVMNQSDFSYESTEQRASRSLKKRKYEKLEQIPEGNHEFEMELKKTKLTLNPPTLLGVPQPEKMVRVDSSGGSMDNDPSYFNKENNASAIIGTKKITEFFKPKEAGAGNEKANTKTVVNKSKTKPVPEKKQELVEVAKDIGKDKDKEELEIKIKELEERLDYSRKEREKDMIKSEKEIASYQEKFAKYTANVHKIIARHVLEIENYKRNERKSFLSRQRQRLGEYVSQREGSKFVDVWSDGFEMRSVKEKLENIVKEREDLEKKKKNLKSKKLTFGPTKTGGGKDESLLGMSGNVLGFNENSDSNLNADIKEAKERMTAKITMLQREENLLREQLEKLEAEKVVFYQQYKKQYEEDHSRYGRPNAETNAPAWPILSVRYQLLSLLGKGGFSEVYKAYDLEGLNNVACKVHQLNPNWTENAKSNYVKHANRESEVHKELNHPNIVRLFDCISIDDHSFATILEYCEGPDLSTYLKQYKIIPEKEAKVIIKQILAGLKYLNDHKTKIIHYDLKPQNVMFHKGEIKISDFGLCKIVDPDVSRIELTSQGVGTYWYLPPECFLMDDQPPMINNKVDVWSVGVMYFEMLFGMKPFGHNMSQEKILKEQIILKSYSVNFPSKPAISSEAKEFIKKCLAYNQEDRIDIYEAYEMMYCIKK